MITCSLFRVGFTGNKLQIIEAERCSLIKKTLIINSEYKMLGGAEPDTPITKMLVESTEHQFDYSYSVPFSEINREGNIKRKLNVKITYYDTHRPLDGSAIKETPCIYYSHLSVFQKLQNSFYFNKLWIQQPQSIMWIVNIIVLILACIAAFMNIK